MHPHPHFHHTHAPTPTQQTVHNISEFCLPHPEDKIARLGLSLLRVRRLACLLIRSGS